MARVDGERRQRGEHRAREEVARRDPLLEVQLGGADERDAARRRAAA